MKSNTIFDNQTDRNFFSLFLEKKEEKNQLQVIKRIRITTSLMKFAMHCTLFSLILVSVYYFVHLIFSTRFRKILHEFDHTIDKYILFCIGPAIGNFSLVSLFRMDSLTGAINQFTNGLFCGCYCGCFSNLMDC